MKKYLKCAVDAHRNNIRAITSHQPLIDDVRDLATELWCKDPTNLETGQRAWRTYWYGDLLQPYVDLTIHLSSIDSIKYDIVPILEHILIDWDMKLQSEYSDGEKYKCWIFTHPTKTWKSISGCVHPLKLKFYVYLASSGRCKSVETGETTPIMKIVCED